MDLSADAVLERLMSLPPSRRAGLREDGLRYARERGLAIDGRALPFSPVPLIVGRESAQALTARLDVFMKALWRLEELCGGEGGRDLRDRLLRSLSGEGRRTLDQCPHESAASMRRRFRRLDGFLGKDGYSVIEVNQAAPIGSHFNDVVQSASSALLAALGFDRPPDLLAPRLLDWLVGEYRDRRGAGALPRLVAVPIEHGYPAKLADMTGMAASCEELSVERYGEAIRFRVCFPPELGLRRGRPALGGEDVDLLWRNSATLRCYPREGDAAAYEALCRDPDAIIVNSTRAWLTRSKEVFAVLSDEEALVRLGLAAGDIAALRDCVPLTLNLAREPGRAEAVLGEKDAWVSKPSDSDFGAGVEFGADHDVPSWRALVRARSADGFVFQRRVSYPAIDLPAIDADGALRMERLEYDLCPYHVDGRFSGNFISRANAPSPRGAVGKMNVAAGSRIVPVALA